jgi:Bax protein
VRYRPALFRDLPRSQVVEGGGRGRRWRNFRREFEMISAFERISLLSLAGAVVFAIGAAVVVRVPVSPPAPATFSASDEPRPEDAATASAATANDVVEPAEYDLEAVAAGAPVPRVFAASPPDRREAGGHKVPEESWRALLPLVLLVNEDILADRKELWSIRHNLDLGERLSPEQRIWLDLVAGRYAAPGADLDELARRMDVVPPSIALAAVGAIQAVARVAGRAAKSPAAQRAAPIGRVLGETPLRLDSPLDLVRAYARAVNTASAYQDFRKERERLRRAGEPLDGLHLAAFLPKLQPGNSLGADELSGMIGAHRLTRFDRARLRPSGPAS